MSEPGKKVKDENGVPVGVYDEFGNPTLYSETPEDRIAALRERLAAIQREQEEDDSGEDQESEGYHETLAEERTERYHESVREGYEFLPKDTPDSDSDPHVDEQVADEENAN